MVLRINPNQPALWRDPKRMQLGVGHSQLVLKNLSKAQEQLIGLLYRGIADESLPEMNRHLGLTDQEANEVIDQVGPLLLRQPNQKLIEPELSSEYISSAFSEIIRASLVHGVEGQQILSARSKRSVHIEDLSKPGLVVALGLAAAGVGHLVTHDQGLVGRTDLGPTGYPSQLGGQPRIEALRALLAASPNQTYVSLGQRLSERHLDSIDCAVLIGQQVIEPRRYARWLNRDVAHLAIGFDNDGTSISPLVIPGLSACLMCLEQLRTQQDSSWPVIASQLVHTTRRTDDAASTMFAAGLVIQKILSRLDGFGGFELSHDERSGYHLETKSGLVTEFTWPVWPECGCQSVAGLQSGEES
jgi:hypothetical protein